MTVAGRSLCIGFAGSASALLAGAALVWLPLVAQAEVVDITWQEGGRFERRLTVAPGKFAELCGALRTGQLVHWSFESDGAMNFNIHYHVGKEVRYPSQKEQILRLQGDLTVDSAQDYCWMWVNKSPNPIELAVALATK
ncbi:MAG: hypothetical protein Q8K96_07850 [Rubrivivax sp.]|nr:hypothetical protein [Rubrivivax sp.]